MSRLMRRGLFWLILTAYASGVILWILHVPYAPEKLLQVVPGSATVITMHDGLADRWDNIAEHPVAVTLGSMLGVDPQGLTEMRDDPGFQYILNLIGRNELVTAYVPYAGSEYQPAWVIASWIGGRSHRLKWSVPFLSIKGLERIGEIGDWPVWVYRWEDEGKAGEITLALVEGMIVGCMSSDPMAIETVIESYNGEFPSALSRSDLSEWNEKILHSDRKDRVWYNNQMMNPAGPLLVEFDLGSAGSIQGRATFPGPEGLSSQEEPVLLDGLSDTWKDHPIAMAVADAAAVLQLDDMPDSPYVEIVTDLLRETGGRALALGLFGEKYSGRFKGIKIPTVMGAVQLPEPVELNVIIHQLADRWNARYQWGVVPVLSYAGTTAIYRLEGTANNFYAGFAATEQIAFTRAGDWLIASSNFKALEKMMLQAAGDTGGADAAWSEKADDMFAGDGRVFLGADLIRANDTLRLAISAYSLKLLFEDPSGSKEQRQQLNEVKAWLEIISQIGQLYMYSEMNSEHTVVTFEAGP